MTASSYLLPLKSCFVTCNPAAPTAFPLFRAAFQAGLLKDIHPSVCLSVCLMKADVVFLCSGTDRSDSDPVEDTDTSSFGTEIVSAFEHFLSILSFLFFFFGGASFIVLPGKQRFKDLLILE